MSSLRLLVLGLILLVPGSAAHHWNGNDNPGAANFGDSGCPYGSAECYADYLCTGGAPPQAVDLVLHCGLRAAGEAEDVALWAPYYAWWWLEVPFDVAEGAPNLVNTATAAEREEVNTLLCESVWSFFCANPIALPEHITVIDDPVGPYPL